MKPRPTHIHEQTPLERSFRAIGARIRYRSMPLAPSRGRAPGRRTAPLANLRVDIVKDRRGELFVVEVPDDAVEITAVDLDRSKRRLLLQARSPDEGNRSKILCGFDERHWFVAPIRNDAAVTNIRAAIESLKPREVRIRQERCRVKAKRRDRRRNAAFVRQGEWFFIPRPELHVPPEEIRLREPISRGGGKPHWVDELARVGGETLYVCQAFPEGLSKDAYRKLQRVHPDVRRLPWQVRVARAIVHARGRVRHADHKTITLPYWHEVLLSREGRHPGWNRQHVFID